MPNLRKGSKGGFEPGLTILRVRHSTAELTCSFRFSTSATEMCFIPMNIHNEQFNGVRHIRWQQVSPLVSTFSTSSNRLLSSFFVKRCILPPALSLWYPIPFSKCVVFPCCLEMLMFLLAIQSFFAVNPSSDHFPTDAVVPPSDHYRTETVLPPSDHCCIETVASCGDHYCIDIGVPSSDHCCTETVRHLVITYTLK